MNRPQARAPRLLVKFLEALEARGELVPGAVKVLAAQASDYRDPGPAIGDLIDYLRGDGKGFLTREASVGMRREPTARFVLDRLPLLEVESARLYGEWAADFAGAEPGEAASGVVRRVVRPDNEHLLLDGPAPGPFRPFVRKARAVLQHFKTLFNDEVNLDELAEKWSDLGSIHFDEGRRRLLGRLSNPDVAEEFLVGGVLPKIYGGDPIMAPVQGDEQGVVEDLLAEIEEEKREAKREAQAELRRLRKELAEAEARRDAERAKLAEYEARAAAAGQAK